LDPYRLGPRPSCYWPRRTCPKRLSFGGSRSRDGFRPKPHHGSKL